MDKEWEKRIYWAEPELTEFDAVIVRICRDQSGIWGLVLNQTAFYPDSGGQPHDLGTIRDQEVIRVVEEDTDIVHYVRGEEWQVNTLVHCRIDIERRHVHMQQHTGQHILSQCFARLLQAETVSFHLGSGYSTIDVRIHDISGDQVQRVEIAANKIVDENHPVLTHYVDPEDLSRFALRKPPVKHGYIRIVSIGEFEHVPCGGTHVRNTGSTGIIKIVKYENFKGITRIHFCCGSRAFDDYRRKHDVLMNVSQLLTSGWETIPDIVTKLKDENHRLLKRQNELLDSLLPAEAESLVREAEHVNGIVIVQKILENKSREQLVKLVKHLVQSPHVVAMLVGASPDKIHAVFARGDKVQLDMREYLRIFLDDLNGKGGGRPELAQGAGTTADNLPQLFSSLANQLRDDLAK